MIVCVELSTMSVFRVLNICIIAYVRHYLAYRF